MTSFAPTIDAAGLHVQDVATIHANLRAIYFSIYGADAYIPEDSQDGQFIAAIAQAIADCHAGVAAVYNAFSPTTAQGNGLSSVVKINGLQRAQPSSSTCDVTLTGQANLTITNGQVQDTAGNTWSLPSPTTIGGGGTVTVTATCQTAGAIA